MDLTTSYTTAFPPKLLSKYVFSEVRNASSVLSASCPSEWQEVMSFLDRFVLRTEDLMFPGGRKSRVVERLEELFYANDWKETRVDTEQIVYKVPKVTGESTPVKLNSLSISQRIDITNRFPHIQPTNVFQEGYLIDALKGRLAVDIEWNAKDGNLDRDILAYRAWYDLGIIDGAILITKELSSCKELVTNLWEDYISADPQYKNYLPPVDLKTSTTTTIEKARERIMRGDSGGCPVLIVGITDQCSDHVPLMNVPNLNRILAASKKRTSKN